MSAPFLYTTLEEWVAQLPSHSLAVIQFAELKDQLAELEEQLRGDDRPTQEDIEWHRGKIDDLVVQLSAERVKVFELEGKLSEIRRVARKRTAR